MRFIGFQPDHLLWIMDVSENVREEQSGMDLLALATRCASKGPCLTLMDGEVAVACGGLGMMFSASAEIWVRLSKKAGPHALRAIKGQMYQWIGDLRLIRLQATGPTSWERLPRFLEWLGMHREAVLEKYGPHGEDYFMYAWVRR